MSVNIPRTFVFSDGTLFNNSMLESEISNIIQTINNTNAGLLTWDNVKAVTGTFTTATLTTPLTIASGGTNSSTTLNSNRFIISSSGKIVEASAVAASKALVSDANGLPTASTTTTTELGYVSGVTSAIQTQINSKLTASAGQYPGTATNDAATAGNIGEYVVSTSSASVSAGTSVQWKDITSISLTAGDWAVTGSAIFETNGATLTGQVQCGISTTSGNSATGLAFGDNRINSTNPGTGGDLVLIIPEWRLSLASNSTAYLKMLWNYSLGTPQVSGYRLSAKRVR